MRLVNVNTKQLEDFRDESVIPSYAILSHTWRDGEVVFQDVVAGEGHKKAGYAKIEECCRFAQEEGLDYAWIDTCCIDKSSSSELSEAINSMFRWYKQARCCYVWLDDFLVIENDSQEQAAGTCDHDKTAPLDHISTLTATFCSVCFRQCRWFSRGWTLQELLAPTFLKFYNKTWTLIGYLHRGDTRPKPDLRNLRKDIRDATNIPINYLDHGGRLYYASIAQRFSWASIRQTSRREDMAYCLLGLCNIQMPIAYGEGYKNAFIRLQEEIMKVSDDQSMFAWGLSHDPKGLAWDYSDHFEELRFNLPGSNSHQFDAGPLLATSLSHFEHSGDVIPTKRSSINTGYPHHMTNRGLRIDMHFLENEVTFSVSKNRRLAASSSVCYIALGCVESNNLFSPLAMCVICVEGNVYARALHQNSVPASLECPKYAQNPLRSIYLLQQPQVYTAAIPSLYLDTAIYLCRKLREHFGQPTKADPVECWDRKQSLIYVADWPEEVILEFPVADSNDKSISLTLSSKPPTLCCRLSTISLQDSIENNSSLNAVADFVALERNGPAHEISAGDRLYRIRLKEDLVLGGVYSFEVDDITETDHKEHTISIETLR